MMSFQFHTTGLTDKQVEEARIKYGINSTGLKSERGFVKAVVGLLKEPMFILLITASTLYFVSGKIGDGIFMLCAIILVAAISLYQDSRSRNALQALKNLTQPFCKVVRNGAEVQIASEQIVIGDSIIAEEGSSIPADGIIDHANDFSVNESILTGESLAVNKSKTGDNKVFQGTTVASGLAIYTVTAIGSLTQLGKIGKRLEEIEEESTPLQAQIKNFVKKMAFVGGVIFLLVWLINFLLSKSLMNSLLKSLTLAMSILPEEIPVAFTTFMALGAWRLMKVGIIVKQTKTVETLGSATVICLDKTGTITENKMALSKLYTHTSKKSSAANGLLGEEEKELIRLGMWSSEPIPFDPMEIALHKAYTQISEADERLHYKLIHEYPLEGKPPMMTHIFEDDARNRIIAAKGAPEALINASQLTEQEKREVQTVIHEFASEGYRVLGVGVAQFDGAKFPSRQQDYKFRFVGLVAFYDPPKANIKEVFESIYKAGIQIKIVTGDNTATTSTIARQVGFKGYDNALMGDDLMALSEGELKEKVMTTAIFARMFPEAKLRIINALKSGGQIVAMTGDGVNDGPALKAAHIGVAMGNKGSEIAKRASSLILVEDNLARLVDAIAMGRKIYTNLKKAIQYIISIHIPIILTVFIPLLLGWIYPAIFSPVHVIFLEMIMGPTCSIIYENEPMEKNAMLQPPRPFTTTFFKFRELMTSIVQGLMMTLGTLSVYQYSVHQLYNENIVRTMVFLTLISANLFLTLVNRSFYYSVLTTRLSNRMVPLIILITIGATSLILLIPTLRSLFEFEMLTITQLAFSIAVGFISVIWFEIIKWKKRQNAGKLDHK